MNFLPLIIGFLAFKLLPGLFGNNNTDKRDNTSGQSQKKDTPFGNIEDIQSALQLVSVFNKIKDKKADIGEVMGEVLSNPLAMELLKRFGNSDSDTNSKQDEPPQPQTSSPNFDETNEESTTSHEKTKDEDMSEKAQQTIDSKELFEPVENIAGVELTEKLKKYYENWYI